MKGYISDIIRRVEILARVINGETAAKADYAEEYKVASVTINRDLEWLREYGIQIFSRKNRIAIEGAPPKQEIIKLLSEYLPLKLNSDVYLQHVKIFSKGKDVGYLSYLTLLAKAVNEGRYIDISYQRLRDEETQNYKLKPIRLITSGYNWILHAIKEDETIPKSYYVSRMKKVSVSNMFRSTIVSENKKEAVKMIFRFPSDVSSEISDKIWFDDFNTTTDEQGNIILETNQEITNRLASWCISWWNKIEILEPMELKSYIYEMFDYFSEKNKL